MNPRSGEAGAPCNNRSRKAVPTLSRRAVSGTKLVPEIMPLALPSGIFALSRSSVQTAGSTGNSLGGGGGSAGTALVTGGGALASLAASLRLAIQSLRYG